MSFIDKVSKLPTAVRDFFGTYDPMIEMKKSFALFEVDSSLSKNIDKILGTIKTEGGINKPNVIKFYPFELLSYNTKYEIVVDSNLKKLSSIVKKL